jgi:acyl-CoA synthetase (AMP-forming)/AMP-acid ligase II
MERLSPYFACFKSGLIAVPINNRLKAPEIAYILKHSKAKLCFAQPELASGCEEACCVGCPNLQRIYTTLPFFETTVSESVTLPVIHSNQIATILYTSGTTAQPKGVTHTHWSLSHFGKLMCSLGLDESDTLLPATQLMHIAALSCALLPGISCGGPSFCFPLLMPLDFWTASSIGDVRIS